MIEIGAIVALVTAIMQVAKKFVPKEYRPLTALVLGSIVTVVWGLANGGDMTQLVFTGVVAGLSASGLYDQSLLMKARKDA